jgi:hypothetical protein
MIRRWKSFSLPLLLLHAAACPVFADEPRNLVTDGSFEQTMQRNQFGHVFKHWGGWKYEGDCEFRVGAVAHSCKTSCLLFGASQPKIRVTQQLKAVPPGRYRVTAFIRGLDLGEGASHMTTEFAFDDRYLHLKKNGTFGWTPLTYVVTVKELKDVNLSFGLWAPGYFWIDDVAVVAVGADVPVTPEPVLGPEEETIAPPSRPAATFMRCPQCGYKNDSKRIACYACGAGLAGETARTDPPIKLLTSFEDRNPFDGGRVVTEHSTDGTRALRLDRGYASWAGPQDWSGYDYLMADLYTDAGKPLPLSIEIQDRETRDYWTRVNYETVAAPGKSTLVLPLAQLYVGEKSRPGRNLVLSGIRKFVLSIGDQSAAPLYVDNLRLERDTETAQMLFDGLYAFDFGPTSSPLMPGFTRIDPSTVYSKGRGYGLKEARVWRAFDVLQPDPLYQDFLCIEKGGLAVDLPNGTYHVFVNIDNPSGFWGEYQVYRNRAILAQGSPVVQETMSFDSFKQKYFRFWDTEDLPDDNTFDKYQRAYFHEKEFDATVTDGQLKLDFQGDNWSCSVSAVILYPVEKAAQGRKFLDYVVRKRRFFFDNYFHRVLHKPTGDPLAPTQADTRRGFVVFSRDYMEDVYYNDTPRQREVGQPVTGFGFAGEHEPLTAAIYPLADLGKVSVAVSDLTGPGTIASRDISVGYVSYRITRVSMDGAVYRIDPRLIIPRNAIAAPKAVARRFWLTVHPPEGTAPGTYRGEFTITPEHGETARVPVSYRVYPGTLDAVDVPAGPFSHEINLPWDGNDPAAQAWNNAMAEKSLRKLRDYGFTTFSGMPIVRYLGFKNGKPVLDFNTGDRQMRLARQCGFTMPVITYVSLPGMDLYYRDEAAMKAAGFTNHSQFVKAVFGAIQEHAERADWLPVYWNLADEPIGDDLRRAAENAAAYRAAFPQGPPWFTGATSFSSGKTDDPHYRLAKALHVANLNEHNEESIRLLHDAGGGWSFYNGGNRWTYGTYMYKAAKQFGMKYRLSWHWNACAGDPYYALDCREDDYAWCNSNPAGELIPSVHFEREMREGLDDYRYLLTLSRLAREKNDRAGLALVDQRLASFKLGQRDHDALFPVSDWRPYREQVAQAIARLRETKQ